LLIEGALSKDFSRAGVSIEKLVLKYGTIAEHILTLGTCATFGGIFRESGYANSTGLHFEGERKIETYKRPKEHYAYTVHNGCTRNEYFEYKVDAHNFGSLEGCMFYEHGCKAPYTQASCNKTLCNEVSSKTRVGHLCLGCMEPNFPQDDFFVTKKNMSIPQNLPLGVSKRAYLTLAGVAKAFKIERYIDEVIEFLERNVLSHTKKLFSMRNTLRAMKRATLLLTLLFLELMGDVVPNDLPYYKHKDEAVEIIYTKENLPFAVHSASLQKRLHKSYEELYGWELDETLYIGLASHHNQIANGFSSQWPNNRQINYIGGTQLVDEFATTSWLDGLLYHESAHNYQTNVKASGVSQFLHTIFANGSFFIPFFTVPNLVENPFMLEGNAVLNESWHGNGGRLYSGRNKAQTIIMAKAGKLTPQNLYNLSLEYPYYSDFWYTQGGFYYLFLAQKYGLERSNSYFKNNSVDFYWPFFTNSAMRRSIGVDFEESLLEFADEYKALANDFEMAEGEKIASSKFFYQLGSDSDEIFFLINRSGVEVPELVVINKRERSVKTKRDSWIPSKVIKDGANYYTQASAHTSPTRIYQGLYDSKRRIKKDTESKMIQGYLRDARAVYFDVLRSFEEPHLYIAEEFYGIVNSSVFIDKDDNLYYFRQSKKRRTLYKNKTPLLTYEGFYGVVMDVDSEGGVCFVANSQNGATLYRHKNGKTTRLTKADNIVEAKLLSDTELLIVAQNADEYSYLIAPIDESEADVYETKLFFEDESYYGTKADSARKYELGLEDSYNSLFEMNFGGSDLFMLTQDSKLSGSISLNFADPLEQNRASLYFLRDERERDIAGLSYSNNRYLLEYSIKAYKTMQNRSQTPMRESGVTLDATLPLYKSGYSNISLRASYSQDYELSSRDPISIAISLSQSYRYGVSMYDNYQNGVTLYNSQLNKNSIYGANYTLKHDLINEFYLGFEAKYSAATADITELNSGVKISNTQSNFSQDISTIVSASLDRSYYLKEGGYAGVNITKVLNFSKYFFTTPLSLQREALYAKYRSYALKDFAYDREIFSEITVGATISSVFFNKVAVPISIEYIYNNASFLQESSRLRFLVDLAF